MVETREGAYMRNTKLGLFDASQVLSLLPPKSFSLVACCRDKSPALDTSRRRISLSAPPDRGVYGIVPCGRLLIFDVDVSDDPSQASPLEDQVSFLSDVFDMDLNRTLWVHTPSGGAHIYVDAGTVLRAGSLPAKPLRGRRMCACLLAEAAKMGRHVRRPDTMLSVDVRHGGRSGYVIGPGSHSSQGRYTVDSSRAISLAVFPSHSLHLLSAAYKASEGCPSMGWQPSQGVARRAHIDNAPWDQYTPKSPLALRKVDPNTPRHKRGRMPSKAVVENLRHALVDRVDKSFHAQRAFVFHALVCCFCTDAIADVCHMLDIDRDTARQSRRIGRRACIADLNRIDISPTHTHGPYVHGAHAVKPFYGDTKHEFDAKAQRARIARGASAAALAAATRRADVAVINFCSVMEALDSVCPRGRRQGFRDALSIVVGVAAPTAMAGASSSIMVSSSWCINHLHMSRSRYMRAMTLLRTSGVLVLRKHGSSARMIPKYAVGSRHVHCELSQLIDREMHFRTVARTSVTRHRAGFDASTLGDLMDDKPLFRISDETRARIVQGNIPAPKSVSRRVRSDEIRRMATSGDRQAERHWRQRRLFQLWSYQMAAVMSCLGEDTWNMVASSARRLSGRLMRRCGAITCEVEGGLREAFHRTGEAPLSHSGQGQVSMDTLISQYGKASPVRRREDQSLAGRILQSQCRIYGKKYPNTKIYLTPEYSMPVMAAYPSQIAAEASNGLLMSSETYEIRSLLHQKDRCREFGVRERLGRREQSHTVVSHSVHDNDMRASHSVSSSTSLQKEDPVMPSYDSMYDRFGFPLDSPCHRGYDTTESHDTATSSHNSPTGSQSHHDTPRRHKTYDELFEEEKRKYAEEERRHAALDASMVTSREMIPDIIARFKAREAKSRREHPGEPFYRDDQ